LLLYLFQLDPTALSSIGSHTLKALLISSAKPCFLSIIAPYRFDFIPGAFSLFSIAPQVP
jgi:hypothetical protein